MTMDTSCHRFHGATLAKREVAGLRLVERSYAPGQRTPKHSHDRAYVGLILEGFSVQATGSRQFERGPMTALLYPPGQVHSERFGDDFLDGHSRVETRDGVLEDELRFATEGFDVVLGVDGVPEPDDLAA